MIDLLIYFVVAVILFSVAYWVITVLVPEGKVRQLLLVLLAVVGAIVVCYILLSFTGGHHRLPNISG